MSQSTREKILAAVLKLLESPQGIDAVTMRGVATRAGITPMATYKHFANRDALLHAATAAEYGRLSAYITRANSRKSISALHSMLGYFDYACDHPHLFRYMFSSRRKDLFTFPVDLNAGKSPTLNMLHRTVAGLMEEGILKRDDVFETSLTIWAHAHGLITLYLAGRIKLSRNSFRKLYLRSLDRLLDGIRKQSAHSEFLLATEEHRTRLHRVRET